MTFKEATRSTNFRRLSEGNKKLNANKNVKFLIWNLPAIKTCPFATENCKRFCYALKAERCYPSARNARKDNYNRSLEDSFTSDMIFTISAYLEKKSYRDAKKVVVRIHESGDFYSREYTKKWLAIAKHFEDNKKIVFMAYTKSVEFFKGEEIPNNMVVRFSLWDDTDIKQAMTAALMGLPLYTAVEKFTDEPKIERCGCVDCGKCGKCWNKNIKTLKCEIH